MLDKHGREPYTGSSVISGPNFDKKRACNEIALINRSNGTVIYGIDSLYTVIGNSFPFFRPLFAWPLFRNICIHLYSFISYNRKVIAPGTGQSTCVPDFNLKYRWAYIFFAWLITSLTLTYYTALLLPLVPASNLSRESFICGGQILFQATLILLIMRISNKALVNYLGHLMTVSLMGALALLPAFLFNGFLNNPLLYLGYFMLVVCLMLLEHARRVKLLTLPWTLSLSWVLYRLLVLMVIFYLI